MAGARGDNLATRLTSRTWQQKRQITTPVSPPTALAADIFYWYILSHVRSPASSGVSNVSGGVRSTASAAIVCVTVLLEDYPKSEAFFNGSRQHFPPSLSGLLTLRTLISPSLPVVQTLHTFQSPNLWGLQTLRALRLRVFRTLKLFVLSDFESLGGTDSVLLRLRVFRS